MQKTNVQNRIALNKSDFTGEAFTTSKESSAIYIYGDLGTGQVQLERYCADGVWRSFPTTTYDRSDSWAVDTTVNEQWRITVIACTDVSVEVV